MIIHCVQKKTPTHIFFHYLHELFVDLNKNCSEYTQGLIDSDNVKIRYLLRSMTSLWRHICLAEVGASLQHAISRDTKDIFFASTGYLLVHRRGHIVYYVVEFKTIILTLNKFSFINLIKLNHHWREIMLQQLNVVDDSCESTLVLKRKVDILRISYDISVHQ